MKDTHHSSPGYLQYVVVAVALGVLTAIEFLVVSEFWPASLSGFTVTILLVLTVIKAVLVALFYMHLKFDSRLYSALFAGAIILFAIPLAIVLMILFQYAV